MAANSLLIALAGLRLHLEISATLLLAVLAAQIWDLIRYVERSNREVASFLAAIRQDDFSQSYPADGRGGAHDALRRQMTEVVTVFRRVRSEREESFHYLRTLVRHVEIGLIVVADDGGVALLNPAAKRLLGVGAARHLREIEPHSAELATAIGEIPPGGRSLLKLDRDTGTAELTLAATNVRIGERSLKLISLHDIARELDERELEAWQQQAQVLNHEIANSIGPIASLATTARDLLHDLESEPGGDVRPRLESGPLSDLHEIVGAIARRSQGLVRFTEEYRRLTRLPRPRIREVRLRALLDGVKQLLLARPEIRSLRVTTGVDPPELELMADGELVEQALLNIGLNAVQALQGQEDGTIELRAGLGEGGRIVIRVADNGPGISEAALEKIFVPFFSTKAEGSGIGLSLARRIVKMHGGDIRVDAAPGERTVFSLRF
jgi:nitrogen fixation/metabolism regulation signal transduction histidine kinase